MNFQLTLQQNLIIILEWVPHSNKYEISTPTEIEGVYPGNPVAMSALQKCYHMMNTSQGQGLTPADFRELLKTLDVPLTDIGFNQLMAKVDLNRDGVISFEELKNMMLKEIYNEIHKNRHYVAVSLEEAESIRGIMHYQSQINKPVVPNSDLAISLRMLGMDAVLDSTWGMEPAPLTQQATAEQCYRFINSDTYYAKDNISTLLRSLHFNTTDQKQTFFNEVRSCRRRIQRDWKETLAEPVLTNVDEYQWLEFHSMVTAIRTRIFR